jgi:uncharacterized protein YdeI (BOF family)
MMDTTAFRSLAWVVAVLVAWVALVFVAISLGSRQQTTPAQAQYTGHGAETFTDTTRTPVSFTADACPLAQDQYDPKGETVFLEGTLHTVSHTTIDANGERHIHARGTLQGQGEGQLSGDKYVFHSVTNQHRNFRGAPTNFTETQTFNIIRQGSATTTDDLQGKIMYHITVNAQGEVTTEVLKLEFVCK